MKKVLLFSLIIFLAIGCNKDDDTTSTTENKVFTGDITLRTQEEVVTFGNNGYTRVTGKLCIGCGGHNDIYDLSSLSTLKAVNTLSIENNIVLIKLDGLDNLTELDNLLIKQNPLLENLDSFSGITAINTVELDDNASLRNIDGLNNLTAIRERITLNKTKVITLNLENLTVLEKLECTSSRFETISIGPSIVGELKIADCGSLTQFNVGHIEEMNNFYFERNDQLTTLNLENLQKVNGTFSIAGNLALNSMNVDNLTSLQTLNIQGTNLVNVVFGSLQSSSVSPSISITNNARLSNINLNNLTNAVSIKYINNLALVNIQLDSLTTVEDKFTITYCNRLTSIILNSLTELKGYSKIERNSILETFEANNLSKAEDLIIDHNLKLTTLTLPNLSSLKAFTLKNSRLSDLSLEGLQNRVEPTSIFIWDNLYITSLNFGSMTTANLVRIERNANLLNINLQNLTVISGDLRITFNDRLQSFEANSLTHVGELYIEAKWRTLSNISMQNLSVVDRSFTLIESLVTNLDNFSNLNRIDGNLKIAENDFLTDFCGLTNLITNGHVGAYQVYGNGFNPSQQDIIDGNCSN